MNNYEWLAQLKCSSLSVHRNDHAANYLTAAQEIEQEPEHFGDTPAALIEEMKATNTIWWLQIYPNTPIRFSAWYGPTLDSVIEQARAYYAADEHV